VVFLAGSGIPELAKGNPEGFWIALGTAVALILVALVAKYSKLMMKYASLLTLCIICSRWQHFFNSTKDFLLIRMKSCNMKALVALKFRNQRL